MPFKQPKAPGAGIDLKSLNGRLLLIKVRELVTDISTVHGLSDAVSADITVLDGDDKGEIHENVLLFPRVLRAQLSDSIGDTILARLAQGVAKPGQTAPWILDGADEADIRTATKYEKWRLEQRAATVVADDDEEPF